MVTIFFVRNLNTNLDILSLSKMLLNDSMCVEYSKNLMTFSALAGQEEE